MNKQTAAMNTVRAIIKAEPTFQQGFVYTSRVIQAGQPAPVASHDPGMAEAGSPEAGRRSSGDA